MTIHPPAPRLRIIRPDDRSLDPGLKVSSASEPAAAALARASNAILAHQPAAGPALAEALAADGDHVAAHAVLGFARLMLAREELQAPAAAALGDATAAMARRDGGTNDERALVAALTLAVAGHVRGAADALDAAFATRPGALLPLKLSHGLRFMAGDRAGLLARSHAALHDLPVDGMASGFVLGCHAFALEEHGRYAEAEIHGLRAVQLAPEDSWGRHAVSHVHEMRGDTAAGIHWLEKSRHHWSGCNNFSFHMAWHLGLLHLEQGAHDRVLAIYDHDIRPEQTDDFRDMANAVSLLWRLDRMGVDVGSRWHDLAGIAQRRQQDVTLVFAALHTICALVALRDDAGVAAALAAMTTRAAAQDEQACVARRIGLPLARLMAGRAAGAERQGLDRLLAELPAIGGSNAQRDLFLLGLTEMAGQAGDAAAVARLRAARAARAALKTDDRLIARIAGHTAA
ncbi:tetratricopeptide repeat protein [Paracoccus nototheniae]|uniref:Tetratricopeptide repeat protein 38 n=1 Tax=Paracoccus nototheniae TaxID=2489002 RepID=A0ABW4E169_9RHOB|nr:tetratricopeptide repeat protein [Paracoccus nototheniae]